MPKRAPKTKVILNGYDISAWIFRCNLPRFPDAVETVELVMEIDQLSVEEDGTLVIEIDARDGD